MIQRLLLKGLITGNNTCLLVNSNNKQVCLLWNQAAKSVGIKPVLSPTSVLPYSVECALQLKFVVLSVVKRSLKKSCEFSRHSKLSQLWRSERVIPTSKSRGSCLKRAIQKLFQSKAKQTRCIGRIALGSALFVPSTFFKDRAVAEPVKCIPIEIPRETKTLKNLSFSTNILQNVYEFLRLCLRALRLFITFVPILTLYPICYFGETSTDLWWALMLRAVEFSGPIVIKLGQWASTRRDVFPDSCCRQFSRLQRRIQPHSWSFTKFCMRRAFGPNWRKVFVKFDNNRNPVGSGCVAQVYKVWMSANAVRDQELVDEIIADLDDDIISPLEGHEVEGFRSYFGLDDEGSEERALQLWKQERELQRLKEKEREREQLLIEEKEEDSSNGSMDVSAVTESLASDLISSDGFPSLSNNAIEAEEERPPETELEAEEHSLVEAWSEADDKSLPVEEAPPDDLEGLIPVAVKVLHPCVHSSFRRDLKILKACASFITTVYPPLRWLSLPQCVDEFAEFLTGQINLKQEAKNLELFSDHFADITCIKFPRPIRPYVTQKVMVETYEEGEGMGEFIGASGEDKPSELKVNLARIGVDALLKMIFQDNLVHGDMHPGNMLIQNINISEDNVGGDNSSGDITRIMMVDVGCDTFVMDVQQDPNPLRICLLDCGVVARLKEHDLTNFKAVFKQVVLGDGDSVADLFLENSEHQCKDPEAFKAEMTELVQTARQDTISLAQVDVGVLLQRVLSLLLKHQIRLESAFSSVVLSVFVLEGLGRTLDPNMDILERARPMITGQVR